MSSVVKKISVVSILTIMSRLLGLVRDVLFFTCFGVSAVGSAFILAFTIPNLFRRMLGEGTLSSAFIPVYSETEKKHSLEKAHTVLNQVLSRLLIFLIFLSLAICIFSGLASEYQMNLELKWANGLLLNSIIFPYVLFICVSAIMVGALQVHGKFFAGAFSPIILNFFMISCLLIFYFHFGWRDFELAIALCIAVLIGGLFQMAWPWIQLRMENSWKWKFDVSSSAGTEKIKELFFVGFFGAAVGQINIMVSRLLAYSLDEDGALSYLFLSARLIELPLGVFAISISTVFFPELSRAFASGDDANFKQHFARGFRLTLAIILPAAVGLAMLAQLILSVLFQWGKFGSSDVELASQVLLISCLALPFYALAAYLVKAFHSKKEMKTPLDAAVLSFSVNVILSIILMQYYGMYGLAWANVGSAITQTCFLALKLNICKIKLILRQDAFCFPNIFLATFVMFLFLKFFGQEVFFTEGKINRILNLVIIIPACVIIYGITLLCLGFPEFVNFRKKIGCFRFKQDS